MASPELFFKILSRTIPSPLWGQFLYLTAKGRGLKKNKDFDFTDHSD